MKRFVVAYVNFYDNELTQEIVEANTEQDARWLHTKTCPASVYDYSMEDNRKETDAMDANDFQGWCFDCDMLVSVMEV